MGKWKGITADELIMLRQIERINYQLRAVAKEFGTQSRLYKHYENFLTSTKKNTLADAGLIRETKSGGVLQLRADKASVLEMGRYSAYEKAVSRLQKFPTVGQRKQEMIEAYGRRKGVSVKGKREQAEAYKQERQFELEVYEKVNDVLYKYYELEKQVGNGKEFESHNELRRLSRGSHTSPEDLARMVEIAQREIDAEAHNIKEQYDDYLAGL